MPNARRPRSGCAGCTGALQASTLPAPISSSQFVSTSFSGSSTAIARAAFGSRSSRSAMSRLA